MNCENCRYNCVSNIKLKDGTFTMKCCSITHVLNNKSCDYITDDNKVENMDICFNCKYWIGGGDWGLSCEKDYYNCSANGFDEACEQFERK